MSVDHESRRNHLGGSGTYSTYLASRLSMVISVAGQCRARRRHRIAHGDVADSHRVGVRSHLRGTAPGQGLETACGHESGVLLGAERADLVYARGAVGMEEQAEKLGNDIVEFAAGARIARCFAVGAACITVLLATAAHLAPGGLGVVVTSRASALEKPAARPTVQTTAGNEVDLGTNRFHGVSWYCYCYAKPDPLARHLLRVVVNPRMVVGESHRLLARQRLEAVDDGLRGSWPGEAAHGRAHRGPFRAVLRQVGHGHRQILGTGGALIENQRRADAGEAGGIPALVIVGGRGQWDENGRSTRDGELGQRQRPGARDHEIGVGIGGRHVLDERLRHHAIREP